MLVVGAGALLLSSGSGIPPKVSVGGVDVGGRSFDDARAALQEHSRRALGGHVTFTAADDGAVSITLDAATVASAAQIDEALTAAGTRAAGSARRWHASGSPVARRSRFAIHCTTRR